MKKFYAFAAAALAALSMNATVYVVGAGEGLTWDLPGKAFEAGTDGNYTFTINSLTMFKFSTVNTTEWDGDDGFNAHAYATGESTFGADVLKDGGQTLPLVPWGENQEVPWKGDYTITITMKDGVPSTMTAYTTTPRPEGAPTVYLRGNMNDWGNSGFDPEWTFTNVSYDAEAGTGVWELIIGADNAIEANVTFKIADADWGTVNYGASSGIDPDPYEATPLDYNGGDMYLNEDFEGQIVFTITGLKEANVLFNNEYDEGGVENVEVEVSLPVEFFNLQGVRVANPENGLYIRRQGNTASKVYVK